MGIFTRFRDIVSSNINSMLDKAEDPEKLIKLMIHEIEDTLVELKAACAGAMAGRKKVERRLQQARARASHWEERARLAVDKARDDLAREALKEKRRFTDMCETLDQQHQEHADIVGHYQDDIRQLEDKLVNAREKQRSLVQRHIRARRKIESEQEIRRIDSFETIAKFDDLENRIERMEAEADLVNTGRQPSLETEFIDLATDTDIEKELAALKSKNQPTPPADTP
jgi:phage shock protein A